MASLDECLAWSVLPYLPVDNGSSSTSDNGVIAPAFRLNRLNRLNRLVDGWVTDGADPMAITDY